MRELAALAALSLGMNVPVSHHRMFEAKPITIDQIVRHEKPLTKRQKRRLRGKAPTTPEPKP